MHSLISQIPVEEIMLSLLAMSKHPLKTRKSVDSQRWADFQNPFIGDGVNPQNTQSSPASDLGLFGQFSKLYANTNGSFRVQLAIGGWTWSQNFSLAVRTASSRTSLATSIVTLLAQWPCFKGVIIDWEYLSDNGINYGNTGNVVDPSDSANFVLFVQQLRSMYVQQGWNNYTIALCCTPAPEKIQFDVKSLVPLLDQWHVMTYEYSSLNTSCFTNR
jgi:chitinase